MRVARSAVDRILRNRALGSLACSVGAVRGRGIALLWHRIRPQGPQPTECVRAVSTSAFTDQLDLLQELGEVVPLAELESSGRQRRPRFALSFDDDDPGHVQCTLPILSERNLPATFFLSGRWIHREGPYWWEVLEARIRREGLGMVAEAYGLAPNIDAQEIARQLTGTSHAAELARDSSTSPLSVMERHHAQALVAAGMEIGFHTLHHQSLTSVDSSVAREAISVGRNELSDTLGTPIVRFAYPHGHTDRSVTDVVRSRGYASAWTTAKRAVTSGDDRMKRGRWDLGHLAPEMFRSTLIRGLARPGR